MTTQSPFGRYEVFSATNYHTRYPDVTPAARYARLEDAIAHCESVTYRMAVIDAKAVSRGFIHTNWEIEPTIEAIDRTTKHGSCRLVGFFSDNAERELFSFYIDELAFDDFELIGKTEDEAHQLRQERDVAYLRS